LRFIEKKVCTAILILRVISSQSLPWLGTTIARSIGEATEVHQDSSSPQCLDVVKRWMENCTEVHEKCKEDGLSQLPTRVLDVSEDQVRLYETKREREPYLTLSHCWGKAHIITTMTETKEERIKGIPWSSLSKTFQDAITITRHLGFRYIWIDSLCIIQNDKYDWEMEAAKMALVYKGSQLTIAATSSKDGNGGCFGKRMKGDIEWIWNSTDDSRFADVLSMRAENFKPINIEVHDSEGKAQRFCARLTLSHDPWNYHSSSEYSEYARDVLDILGMPGVATAQMQPDYHKKLLRKSGVPLLQRAWVFQEQILSPRIIHFGPYEMVWECRSGLQCECSELNRESQFVRSHQTNPSARKAYTIFSGDKSWGTVFPHIMSPTAAWQKMVSIYTQYDLTYERDRLPALSGIASQNKIDDQYLAGIWASELPHALFWTSNLFSKDVRRSDEYRAPSWAWPSMLGPIHFWPQRGISQAKTVAKYLEGSCTPAGADPRGCVTDGFVKMRAPVARATVSRITMRHRGYSTACEIVLSKDKSGDNEKKSFHTFSLDQTAASVAPSQSTPARYCKGEAGQYIITTPGTVTTEDIEASTSSISLDTVQVTLNQEVFVLFVAYNEGNQTLSGGKKGRGVWALVLRRASCELESYERIGLIWPVLGGLPRNFDEVSENESCDAFLETALWLENSEFQTLTLV
jgi:Heterokaryon incompatibility protein (HET)